MAQNLNLIEHFKDLPDPRVKGRTNYPLYDDPEI